MPESSKFELRRPVSPYICSTPLDFTEERQFLTNEVFPKLSELCRLRGSYFSPADLRWKPGDAKTQEGLLLKTLLDTIKRCSPFFLCLLGETYGPFRGDHNTLLVLPKNERQLKIPADCSWLETNFILAATGGHPWVLQEDHQFSSLTELEIIQGALMCENPYLTIYYRRSDHLDNKVALELESGKEKDQDLSVYLSESEQARINILTFRQRLVNKGVPVKYFSTPQELGQLVLQDWTEIVDICLPPLLHDVQLLDTLEYREWLAQQSFINSRCEVFVSTQEVEETLQQLTEFAMTCTRAEVRGRGHDLFTAADWSSENHSFWTTAKLKKDLINRNRTTSIMLLSGGRGVGKSALAAHWLNEFRADNSHICVISHFVTASNRSMDIVYFLCQSIKSLRRQFLLTEDFDPNSLCADLENECDTKFQSFQFLCEAFVAAIGLGPCVILLDGLNEFNLGQKKFDWLPENLPATCKLVFTTSCSDISHLCLSQRPDTNVVNFPTSLTDVSTTITMLRKYLPSVSQLIGGDKAMKRLAHLKIMQTALGSRVTGSDLSCYRVYSNMGSFMEVCAEVWSLRDFWTMCVQNWVKEHSWTLADPLPELNCVDSGFDYSGWVTDCLCLIVVSRNGLTQDQVISVLKIIGYKGDSEVTSYDWLQFRQAAGPTLRELGDGRLVIGHKYLQEIAEYLFFKSITSCSKEPETIIKSTNLNRRWLYHKYLARYFSQQMLNVQVMVELPWHFLFSGDIASLVNFLTNCQSLMKMLSVDCDLWLEDLELYWSVCQMRGHHPEIVYLQLMHALAVVDINDVQELEDKCSQPGVHSSAQRVLASTPQLSEPYYFENIEQKPEDGFEASFRLDETVADGKRKALEELKIKGEMDNVFVTQDLSDSRCQPQSFSDKQNKDRFSDLAALGWFLARFLLRIDQREVSIVLLSSLVNYIKQNCQLNTELYILLCRCHYSVGKLHSVSGDFDAAEKEYKLALHAILGAINADDEMTFQKSTQYLKGLILSCHGNICIYKKQLFESDELLKEALDCVRDNSDCIVLKSTIYFHLGIIRSCQSDYEQAEFYLRESANLRSQWCGRCHPLVGDVLIALAKLLVTSNRTERQNLLQARSLYKWALSIQEKCFGSNHVSVADILSELGTLLSEENSHRTKMEAQECLQRCLDIRITNLGGNHPVTIATRQNLTKLDVALLTRNFESGFVKHADGRSNRRPFSTLTMRESDLSKLINKDKSKVFSKDIISAFTSSSQELPRNHNRPGSIVSTSLTSASERLLSAPITDMPRLLWRRRKNQSGQRQKHHLPESCGRNDKDIHGVDSREDSVEDKRASLKIDKLHSDHDVSEVQIQKDVTDHKSGNAGPFESVGGNQKQPINVKVQLTQPITEAVQRNQPTHEDNQQNGSISSEDQQNAPITVELQQNEPITEELQQNEPITVELLQNEPITVELLQNEPITAELQQNELIAAELQQNEPDTVEFQQNEPNTVECQRKDGHGNALKEDNLEMLDTPVLDSYAHVMHNVAVGKKSVALRPSGVTSRLFKRFERDETSDRPRSWTTKSRSTHNSQQHVMSGRSSRAATSSSSGSHHSNCKIPGRYDITLANSQTITGPSSCLMSLLGDPPCPRQTSNILHHMSAWYHVPGRYSTLQQPFPKKRMQRTKSAKDIEAFIAIKPCGDRTRQDKLLQLQGQEKSKILNRLTKNNICNNTYTLQPRPPILDSDHYFLPPRWTDRRRSPSGLIINGMEMPESMFLPHKSGLLNIKSTS